MTVRWRDAVRFGAPLTGHCDKSAEGWCNFEGVDQARQAQPQPDGMVQLSVRFGDKDPRYSGQRAVLTAYNQTNFAEGDEIWMSWETEFPTDYVTWYPKDDELDNWPSSGLDAGSNVILHHAPAPDGKYKGDWNLMPQQSSPIYIGVGPKGHYISLTKSITESVPYMAFTEPLVRGMRNQHRLHVKFSADPKKGLIEYTVNGAPLGGSLQVFTIFPDCVAYLVAALYRRIRIGDPSLVWPSNPRPGVTYPPEFVPHMGQRVFSKDDGYPAFMKIGHFVIGTTPADLGATPAPAPVPQPAPTPQPTPTPAPTLAPQPAQNDPAKAETWRLFLVDILLPYLAEQLTAQQKVLGLLQKASADAQANVAAMTDQAASTASLLKMLGALLDKGR